jgi:chemotaxis protein CheX
MKTMTNRGTTVQPEPTWKSILECSVSEVFGMMAGAQPEVLPPEREEPRGEQTAMVGLAGAACGMITIRCSGETARHLTTLMLGGDAASDPSSVSDALGELCNMVAGNFKAKISSLAEHCMLSVPTVITGEDYVLQSVESREVFNVCVSHSGQLVFISLILHI